MNRSQLGRRRFLRTVGATALTYPFLRALPSYAQATGNPQYLILIFTPVGVVRYRWGASGPARPSTGVTVSALESGDAGATGAFRPSLQPLRNSPAFTNSLTGQQVLPASTTDLTSKTIVLDGLNVGAANGSHEAGMAALWTGQLNNGVPATGISVDQAIASALTQQLAKPPPFSSIPLQVMSSQDFSDRGVLTRMLYSASGGSVGFVDPQYDPVAARATIFQQVAGSSAADAGPSPTSFIRQQVFAQLNTELTGLQSRLCTDDRLQLQSVQAQWNALNTELTAAAVAAASCQTPESAPAGYVAPSIDFPTSAKLMMDILAFALQCDMTRVASIQFSTATSQVTHSWLGSSQTDIHHNYSHDGPTSLYSLAPYESPGFAYDIYNTSEYQGVSPSAFGPWFAVSDGGTGQLAAIDYFYAQLVSYLANKLDGMQSVAGGTGSLLDQSVICWGSELDMGAAHTHDDTPFVLIGSCGGKLKTGNLVQFPLNLAGGIANLPPTANRFHNDLLITLAQAMGVNLTTFGTASGAYKGGSCNGCQTVNFVTGPITQILT